MSESPARPLSAFDATLLVVGGVVGVGIFFTPHSVAALLPAPAPFFAAWIIGGLLAAAGALTFAELAATFPHAGGWYVYLHEAFGRLPAFLFAWVVLFVVSTGAAAGIGDFCARQVEALLWPGETISAGLHLGLGAALVLGVTAVALVGIKSGALLQDACTLLKLGALLAFIGGAFLVFEPAPAAPAAAAEPAPWKLGDLPLAMLPVMFAYGGWHIVTYLGHAVREPQRTLPRAMLLGTAIVVVVYLLANAAFVRVLGLQALASEPGFAPIMARQALGSTGGTLLIAAMAVSSLGVCTAILLGSPWVYVAMARDGLFFRAIGAVEPRSGAPRNALLLQAGVALAYMVWGQAGVVVDAVVFAEWIFHVQCGLALLRLRRLRPELPRPFRSPWYPAAPLIYSGVAAIIVVASIMMADPRKTGIGLGVLAVGAVAYAAWRRLARA